MQITDRTSVSVGLATVVLLAMSFGVLAVPAVATDELGSESTEITVAENGSIEQVEMVWGVNETTYDEYEMYAEAEGYDQVDAWYESLYEEADWVSNVSVTSSQVDGGYVLSFELVDVDTNGTPNVNVTADGDTVVYEEFNVTDPDDTDVSELTYRVNMPGEITDSNAHEVRDDVAVWHLHDEHTSELFVEATVADSVDGDADRNDTDEETDTSTGNASDTDDSGENNDDEDGLPGFGGAAALVALCIATALTVGRRIDR